MNETATPAGRIARSGQDLPVSGFLAPRRMRGMDGTPWGDRPAGTRSGNDDDILDESGNAVKSEMVRPGGFEPPTPAMSRRCPTAGPRAQERLWRFVFAPLAADQPGRGMVVPGGIEPPAPPLSGACSTAELWDCSAGLRFAEVSTGEASTRNNHSGNVFHIGEPSGVCHLYLAAVKCPKDA